MIPRRKPHILRGDFLRSVGSVFRKKQQASKAGEFEEAFAKYIGARSAITVSSGRFGMEIIFQCLDLKEGDEVIIPAYTLKDLIPILQNLGLKVVCADIDRRTFNIDPESIRDKITNRTRAILATHMFGAPCKINDILSIASEKSIIVIEDCAHAAGSSISGRKTGSFGLASFFSFEITKPINTYGGGMIATDNEKFAQKIRAFIEAKNLKPRVPFKKIIAAYIERAISSTPLFKIFISLLSSEKHKKKMTALYRRMQKTQSTVCAFSGFQADIGLKKLNTLDSRMLRRKEKINFLQSLVNKDILLQELSRDKASSFYLCIAIATWNSVKLRRMLLKGGIDSGIGNEIADDCGAILGQNDCLGAGYVFKHAIQIPLYETLSEIQIKYIASKLNECHERCN